MKTIRINNEIFKCEVLVIYDCDQKEANKYLRSIKNDYLLEENSNNDGGLIKINNGNYRIIWLSELSNSPISLARLAHELFHLVIRICEDKGVPNIPNVNTGHCGDETGAYLIDFYTREILKKLKGRKVKKKKP